ncbi:M1 family metallopeptidase [Sphingosinicella sp.]|uniref:M1 family metallopeptidase n=1 Tax=Sphingosinicella sp. TaxID=1917971 RepID=UPI004037BF4D
MRPALLVSSALIALTLTACDPARRSAPAASAPPVAQVPTQLPRNVRPLSYSISAQPDAANLRFSASVLIEVEVLEATDTVTLNAAELDISSVTLNGERRGRVSTDANAQTATFRFDAPIAPGRHRLAIAYAGRINTQAAGLFALDYATEDGSQRRSLFTQFEAPDARRFFPGWDEPNFRTPYDLAVVVPAGQQAISNMPEAGREARPDGTAIVRFRTTPAMSSYLLFLAVGEFDRITTTAGGTEIGVVTRRGAGEQGRWALESSARIVPWYNQYFGTPYPLPKLDNVAGPGSSQFFGAMENWGAIFSFESILLVDPAITTEARRQGIFEVAAHEIAHQWFGDLVTMSWWDDLWLNEGFASWMATKATEALHPEWEPILGRVDGREAAMRLDSLATTHPVVQRIQTVEQMSQAFDAITYQKGEAVITMLEDYVGEDAWRRGVQRYIARHRLGNTQSEDLWRAIEEASGRPVRALAHDFTMQPGVPLIRVDGGQCVRGQTQVSLRQGQFSRDNRDGQPLAWRVPVIASTGGRELRTIVEGGNAQAAVPGCGPLVVNYGQAGYYRTLYTPDLLARLTEGFARLRPLDQIGLVADNWALGLAGYQSPGVALDMAAAAPADSNSKLWERLAAIYAQIDGMYAGDEANRARFARYASARLRPVLDRLGWSPRPNERANDAVLRGELIGTLGALRDPAVIAEANRRFDANDPSVMSGPLRQTILAVVAQNADAARWERLRAMARDERNPLVRSRLYQLVGGPGDEALARRALELALTDEPGATNASQIIGSVAGQHPDLAFDFALANRERVEALVDASSRSRFLPGLASGSSDPAMVDKLGAYATRYLTPQSRGSADRAISAIRDRVRVRRERLPEITHWLEARRS